MTKLAAKQKRFVDEYLIDLNATQAAIRAGYSQKTAKSIGQENLTKPDIAAAIEIRMKEREKRTEITSDMVLTELAKIGFFDPRKLFHDDGKPKMITELDDNTASVISGLDVMEEFEGYGKDRVFVGYTKKYKLADKRAALVDIGKHLGMFVDRSEVKHAGAIAHNFQPAPKLSKEEWLNLHGLKQEAK
jgi:phage terminase small subunit